MEEEESPKVCGGKGGHLVCLVCLRRAENDPASGTSRGGEKIKAGGLLTAAWFEGTTTPSMLCSGGTELTRPAEGWWDRVLPSYGGLASVPSLICIPLIGGEEKQGRKRERNNILISNTDRGRWEGIHFRIPLRQAKKIPTVTCPK